MYVPEDICLKWIQLNEGFPIKNGNASEHHVANLSE